jgi:hypothetical protein
MRNYREHGIRAGVTILMLFSFGEGQAQTHPDWQVNATVDTSEINADLRSGEPSVDVGIYYPSNFDENYRKAVPLNGVVEEFLEAKRIFAEAGVQLNLLWVKSADVHPKYFSILASKTEDEIPSDGYANMYIEASRNPGSLSASAFEAFDSIIEQDENNARTVYIVVLQGVYTSYFETDDNGRNWTPRLVRTGGLSFPSYIHGDNIPERLRGVITLTRHDNENYRIIAHELGHKLMNVSHEYMEQSPQHEIVGEGGLMLYGAGTGIPSGEEGRWHKERLLLSPYVYRVSEQGERISNPDYKERGFYYDSLYGDKVVHFEGVRLEGPKESK